MIADYWERERERMGAQQADLIFSDSQYGTQVWGTKCPLIVKICGLCFGAGTKLRTVSTCTQIAYYRKRGHFVPLRSILVLNSYVVVPQFWIMLLMYGLFFGSCDSQNFYLFSWKEEEKEEGKEEKGKGEEREEGGERLVYIEDIIAYFFLAGMVLWLSNSLLQYGGFAMICAFQPYGFIVVSHWLSMCWLILANLDEELPKQEDVCDTSKDTEHNMNVCILCIVEQRRKSWSIHIFNNVYWHTSVCSSWLVGCCICIHTKNSCRILCISYVHYMQPLPPQWQKTLSVLLPIVTCSYLYRYIHIDMM